MLFVLIGASGSGKTTLRHALAERTELPLADLDEPVADRPYPERLGKLWRAEQTEAWLQVALEHQRAGRDFVLFGGVFGELLACPSAIELDGIAGTLLDCGDAERVERIRERGPIENEDLWHHVIWSSWLRMHRLDPGWLQRVITEDDGHGGDVASWLEWQRWTGWSAGDPRWAFELVSTSDLSLADTCTWVLDWIAAQQGARPPLSGRWCD
jgi:hypothetical protein